MKSLVRASSLLLAASLVACAGSPMPVTTGMKASGLTPIKIVEPVYPRRAALARVQGCVTTAFDVRRDGRTDNYLVLDSKPEGLFVPATLMALRDWRFAKRQEPIRTVITIDFKVSTMREDEVPVCETDPRLPEVYRVNR